MAAKKTKKSKAKKASRSLLSPKRLAKLRPFIFVAAFAAVGAIYLLLTHAAASTGVDLVTHDTSGNNISGVLVTLNGSPTGSCNPGKVVSSPKAEFTCTGYYASVGGASLTGYHVCNCSAVKIGTGWKTEGGAVGGIITMEADPPSAPSSNPPPPASPPASTPPASSPPASSGSSGSKASSGSTTHVSAPSKTATPLSVGSATPSTSSVADSSTANPQDSSNTTDQSSNDSNSGSAGPNVLADSSSSVTSTDNLVKVTFPAGTFDADAYCSIDTGDSNDVPVKSASTIGPYSIDCTDSSGSPLSNLKKNVTVAISLPGKGKYDAYANGAAWTKVPSSSDTKTLTFKLAKAELFAAATGKKSHLGTIILNVVGAIVLLAIIGGGLYVYHRRQNPYS